MSYNEILRGIRRTSVADRLRQHGAKEEPPRDSWEAVWMRWARDRVFYSAQEKAPAQNDYTTLRAGARLSKESIIVAPNHRGDLVYISSITRQKSTWQNYVFYTGNLMGESGTSGPRLPGGGLDGRGK